MMETRPGMNAIHKLNHELINNPLTISLGGNKLVLVNGEKWVSGDLKLLVVQIIRLVNRFLFVLYTKIETSDLEEARRREQELVKENDSLKLRLMLLMEQMEFAARETVELKQLNGAAMDMVMCNNSDSL